MVFVSGQIGLIPGSLTMPNPQSLPLETALSLQHLSRIKQSLQEMWSWHDHLQAQIVICWMARKSDWWSVRNAISVLKEVGLQVSGVLRTVSLYLLLLFAPV